MTRPSRPLALLGAAALVGAMGVVPASAQDDGGLGGYTLLARASAVDFTYASPGLLATGDVIFQASMPESMATLASGPTGYALSSMAWPGPLIADIGTIVEQGSPEDSRPPFRVQSYPVRAEAFNPQGPAEAETEVVPGARMHAYAEGAVSAANGSFSHLEVPLVFEIGGVASDATSYISDDDVAVTRSHTVLSDVSILADLIKVSSIETVIEATSDGETATATTDTRLGDVTFLGLAATIDENGIHLRDQPAGGNDLSSLFTDEIPFDDISGGLGQATDPISEGLAALFEGFQGGLNDFAEQSGISVRLLPGITTVSGSLAEASSAGLMVEIYYDGNDTPIITDLLNVLPYELLPGTYDLPPQFPQPPFSPQALALMLKETHINTISVASGLVSNNAAKGFVLPPFDFDFGAPASTGGDSVLGDSSTAPLPTPTPALITTPDAPTAGNPGLGLRPEPSLDQLASQPVSDVGGQALGGMVALGLLGAGAWSASLSAKLADLVLGKATG